MECVHLVEHNKNSNRNAEAPASRAIAINKGATDTGDVTAANTTNQSTYGMLKTSLPGSDTPIRHSAVAFPCQASVRNRVP